jgi:prepilin-type processing-associated H-X9-DG protein
LWQKYIKDPNCFYCPGFASDTFQDRKVVANGPDDTTQMTASKDAQVGWRATPLDVPVDLYVSIHYGIFCGWVRAKSTNANPDNPLRLLLKPDELVPATDPMFALCPILPGRLGSNRSSEIPLGADATLREPGVAPTLAAGTMLSQAVKISPTWWASHRRKGRFDGINTLFLDGHVVWRGADKAAPRLTWDGGNGAYGYLYWY